MAPPSFVTNNIQDITTEVGRENLKWTASCLFAGAWFRLAFVVTSYQPFNWNIGGADTVGVTI